MAHLDTATTEQGTRHNEWLTVGAQIGQLVNEAAGRYDLVGLAGPVAGSGAPACFKPAIAEVEVNTTVAFGAGTTPEMIGDINLRKTQYEFPKATGAILHEAFHARFSAWELVDAQAVLKADEYEALVLLEETRIEKQGLDLDYKNRVFLRASALEIALGDIEAAKEASSVSQLAQLVGLIHGRVLAGILEFDEVEEVITSVNSALGEDIVRQLSTILGKFQAHDKHTDVSDVYPLAIEWARIVREAKEERGETDGGSGSGAGAGEIAEILEKLAEAADGVSIKNYGELCDQQESEEWEQEVKERASASKEQHEHAQEASEVFGKGTGPAPESSTTSRLIETRKPTSSERSAAVVVARMLEKAKYRERDAIEIASVLPPGRLRTKALVQQAALRDKGIHKPVEAFRKTVRKHTDDPTLSVGVLVDISGSMNSAMNPMAVTAWVMSEAVKRVQGRASMVYFGTDVFPTLKAGQSLDDVNVYSATDGTEKFDKAFKAIDGSLNLLHGNGARLLVVVSDGCFTGKEVKATRKWIARCEQAGVAVLWIPFDGGYHARKLLSDSKVKPLVGVSDPVEAATEIGQACAKALTQAGARNS
jgi:hypothetical protein